MSETASVIPQNLDAEMALLGSMMMSRDAIDAVIPIIGRDESHALYVDAHRMLFEVLLDLRDAPDGPIDLIVACSELERRKKLEKVGGQEYMIQLAESFADWANAEHYARIVKECYRKRSLIRIANSIRDQAFNPITSASEIVADAAPQLDAMSINVGKGEPQEIRDAFVALPEWWDRARAESIQTGIIPLDAELGGLERPSYVIVGARPSVGKSSLLLHLAREANAAGAGVLFFVLEAGNARTAQRFAGHLSGNNTGYLKRHASPQDRQHAIQVARNKLTEAPLYLADRQVDLHDILATARLYIRRHNIKMVIVDYVQIVKAPKCDTRDLQIGMISDALRRLSLDSDCIVIAAAQLRRGADPNRPPGLEQLRESGNLEQDADVAILLHRTITDKYSERMLKEVELDVIVAKNKDGPTPAFQLTFNKPTFAFTAEASPASDYHPEPQETEALPY